MKLAITLAVDTGDYDRAVALIEVAKRTTKPAAKDPIARLIPLHERPKG